MKSNIFIRNINRIVITEVGDCQCILAPIDRPRSDPELVKRIMAILFAMIICKICVPRVPSLIEGCDNNDVIVVQDSLLHVVKVVGCRRRRGSFVDDRNRFGYGVIGAFYVKTRFTVYLGNLRNPEIQISKKN